jgi:hypothetical protein
MPTVIAAFRSLAEAERALKQVQALGVEAARVDSLVGGDEVPKSSDPVRWGRTGYTLESSRQAAYTSANMAPGQGLISPRNVVLTVVAHDDLLPAVRRTVEEAGGAL